MIMELFTALEDRFKSSKTLELRGRKLYIGIDDTRIKTTPFVGVTVTSFSPDDDSFGTDFETAGIEFAVVPQEGHIERAAMIMDELMRTYDDVKLESPAFCVIQLRRTDAVGPSLSEGIFTAGVSYQAVMQRRALDPVVRGVA